MNHQRYKDPDYKKKWGQRARAKDPERYKEYARQYYLTNKERITKRLKSYRKRVEHTDRYKNSRRRQWMRVKYGITQEQYNAMMLAQKGVCGICNKEEQTRWRRLAVDHDHQTGKVRGLLCFKCNMMLAYFEDSDWCNNASEYLRKHKG